MTTEQMNAVDDLRRESTLVHLQITCENAIELFEYFQDTEDFNYWETPLAGIADQLKSHYMYGCKNGCTWSHR